MSYLWYDSDNCKALYCENKSLWWVEEGASPKPVAVSQIDIQRDLLDAPVVFMRELVEGDAEAGQQVLARRREARDALTACMMAVDSKLSTTVRKDAARYANHSLCSPQLAADVKAMLATYAMPDRYRIELRLLPERVWMLFSDLNRIQNILQVVLGQINDDLLNGGSGDIGPSELQRHLKLGTIGRMAQAIRYNDEKILFNWSQTLKNVEIINENEYTRLQNWFTRSIRMWTARNSHLPLLEEHIDQSIVRCANLEDRRRCLADDLVSAIRKCPDLDNWDEVLVMTVATSKYPEWAFYSIPVLFAVLPSASPHKRDVMLWREYYEVVEVYAPGESTRPYLHSESFVIVTYREKDFFGVVKVLKTLDAIRRELGVRSERMVWNAIASFLASESRRARRGGAVEFADKLREIGIRKLVGVAGNDTAANAFPFAKAER